MGWDTICSGLERNAPDEHNIWRHQSTNPVAWNFARFAEIFCEKQDAAGPNGGRESGKPGREEL